MSMNALRIARSTDIAQQTADFQRKIGGSMIGAIMGCNPYMSRMEAYAQLSGLMPGPDDNMAMKMGRLLEPVVAHLYQEETGNKVRRVNYLLQHPEYNFATANVDRETKSEKRGSKGILEIKTASEYQDSTWRTGAAPVHYYCQLQWYLWITGYEWGAFAALVGGNKFYTFEVERDKTMIEWMKDEAYKFWHEHVLTGTPPEPDATDSCKKALEAIYRTPEPAKETELPDVSRLLIEEYLDACKAIKEAEDHKDYAGNHLRALMGDAELGILNGEVAVTYKATKRGRVLKVKGGA